MMVTGDIGGTNARMAVIEREGLGFRFVREQFFPSKKYPGLIPILEAFLKDEKGPIEGAAFGIAGPVRDGKCIASNLPWSVDSADLAKILKLPRVGLVNDLKANAYGLRYVQPKDLLVLSPGKDERGNAAILSLGTGLGEAGLIWDGERHRPIATEGGHTDFGPRNQLEMELLTFLLKELPTVSYERIVSGPGLVNIYRFLRATRGGAEPAWLTERLSQPEPAAAISSAALEGKDALCVQALDLFVGLAGAEAGNLALKLLTVGGIYIGGGIAPKILPKLKDKKLFYDSFVNKGRMSGLLEQMPLKVILDDRAALWGAAHCAAFGET